MLMMTMMMITTVVIYSRNGNIQLSVISQLNFFSNKKTDLNECKLKFITYTPTMYNSSKAHYKHSLYENKVDTNEL